MLAAGLALAACSDGGSGGEVTNPSPLLYEIAGKDGQTEGWLFGTIHSLPEGTRWRTDELDETIVNADGLIVEVAALDDSAAIFDTYREYATTPGQPDIATRVPREKIPQLLALIDRAGYSPRDFHSLETWAVALNLAQAYDTGESGEGADRALLRDFKGRPVKELEGAARQFAIFDSLPESEQADLLVAVLDEAESHDQDPGKLRRNWLKGDLEELIAATREGMMADPELRQVLLVDRNRAWVSQIDTSLKQSPRPLIAVGAAHLVGPDGLAAHLEKRGYTVTRLQ